jgi:hypothetical protein
LEKHLMDIIGFMRQIMKHTLITLLVAIAITVCSPFTPAPTAITLPSPTIASTQTPVPTFTVTLTPAPAAGEKMQMFVLDMDAAKFAEILKQSASVVAGHQSRSVWRRGGD